MVWEMGWEMAWAVMRLIVQKVVMMIGGTRRFVFDDIIAEGENAADAGVAVGEEKKQKSAGWEPGKGVRVFSVCGDRGRANQPVVRKGDWLRRIEISGARRPHRAQTDTAGGDRRL